VEAMVTRAVENHPNSPTVKMDRVCEEYILSDEDKVALVSAVSSSLLRNI